MRIIIPYNDYLLIFEDVSLFAKGGGGSFLAALEAVVRVRCGGGHHLISGIKLASYVN